MNFVSFIFISDDKNHTCVYVNFCGISISSIINQLCQSTENEFMSCSEESNCNFSINGIDLVEAYNLTKFLRVCMQIVVTKLCPIEVFIEIHCK